MTTATHPTHHPLNGNVTRWRNLYFRKSGESCLGTGRYETAEAARARFEEVYPRFAACASTLETNKGDLCFEDYAWSMQYPVME